MKSVWIHLEVASAEADKQAIRYPEWVPDTIHPWILSHPITFNIHCLRCLCYCHWPGLDPCPQSSFTSPLHVPLSHAWATLTLSNSALRTAQPFLVKTLFITHPWRSWTQQSCPRPPSQQQVCDMTPLSHITMQRCTASPFVTWMQFHYLIPMSRV